MAVPTQLSDLNVVIASNSPASTDSTGSPSTVDDFFRAHAGLIAQVNAAKAPLASPTFTGTVTAAALTTTGNVILGDAATDTLNVGANGIVKDASGNVGIGIASPTARLHVDNATSSIIRSSNGTVAMDLHGTGTVGVVGTSTAHDLTFFSHNAEAARFDSNKYCLIGYTSSNGAYKLQVNSQIFATNATVATSDARFKEKVKTLKDGLALVNALRPVSFEWKAQADVVVEEDVDELEIDANGKEKIKKVKKQVVKREKHNFSSGVQIGFIAQEVQSAFAGQPWLGAIVKQNSRPAVTGPGNSVIAPAEEFYGLAESSLIALLVQAVQELSAKVKVLEGG